jgi:hypothetical protein
MPINICNYLQDQFSIKHLYQGIDYLFSLKNDKFFIEAGPGARLTEINGNLFSVSKKIK